MDSDGTTCVVNGDTNTDAGIYERQSGSSWTLAHSVLSKASYYSRGGCAISYDGTMVVVGDYSYGVSGSGSPGRAYVHQYSSGSWSLTITLVNPTSAPEEYWGQMWVLQRIRKTDLLSVCHMIIPPVMITVRYTYIRTQSPIS